MGILCRFEDLKNVVLHDVNALERYNNKSADHTLSTICFKNGSEMESRMLSDILAKASRKSDVVFYDDNVFVLVMPATDKDGAKHIFSEMHSVCKDIKNMEILSYPNDAFNDIEYFKKVEALVSAINNG